MQRRIGHGDTGNLHRLQPRDRRDRSGASDLEFHVEQLGELFHGRKFMGDRPARLAGTETQLALRRDAVDLEHHAVDFVRERIAAFANVAVVIQALIDTVGQFQLMADRHAPGLELLQVADMRIGNIRRNLADAVAAKLQRPVGSDLRVQLPQAARRCVARIGESLAADFQLRGVEPLETGLGHEHFTAHFQRRRPTRAV
ncbi:hypothetical protein D3C86_1516880 [compost metagenome]